MARFWFLRDVEAACNGGFHEERSKAVGKVTRSWFLRVVGVLVVSDFAEESGKEAQSDTLLVSAGRRGG